MLKSILKCIGIGKNKEVLPPSYFLPSEMPNSAILIAHRKYLYKGYVYKFYFRALPDEGFNKFFGQGDGRNAYLREEKYQASVGDLMLFARSNLLNRKCPLCFIENSIVFDGYDLMCQRYYCINKKCDAEFERNGRGIFLIKPSRLYKQK